MHVDDAVRGSAKPIQVIPSRFVFDPATHQAGAAQGFEGLDQYVCGRGGYLGEATADEVVEAFGLFEPSVVRTSWERGRQVMPPADAAQEWLGLNARWLEQRLPAPLVTQLAAVADEVAATAEQADVDGGALFFGLRRTLPPPGPAGELALHLTALRELRGAFHRQALAEAGLRPVEALVVHDPVTAAFYGWPEPWPDPDPLRARWEGAEARTDAAMADVFALVAPGRRAELVELGVEALALVEG